PAPGAAPTPGVTPGAAPAPGVATPAGTEGQGTPSLAGPGAPGAPAAGGAAAPAAAGSTDPAAVPTVPGTGSMLDVTILADTTVTDPTAGGFILEGTAPQRTIGGMEVGSVACFDNVDLTGVQSIDVSYARDGAAVSASGRFAILLGGSSPLLAGSDLTTAENLGEKLTTTTGAWTTFQPINVQLSRAVNEVRTVCFRGLQGNGILNFESFTLRSTPGTNDGVTNFNAPPPDRATVPQVALPQVVGSQVQFGGPNTSVAGPSLFWSNGRYGMDRFYNADVVDWVAQDWGARIVRAAMAVDDDRPGGETPVDQLGGYVTRKFDSTLNVKRVVNAAISNGIYVIIDWHAHRAEQNTQAAVEFFGEMAATYGAYENVIYEIYNEPANTGWQQVKQYAQPVMAAIRAQDPDNLIIVGTPGYSSDVEAAAADPIVGDRNLAYTLHFYAGEGAHDQYRTRATNAMNAGIALMVTEWGTTPASGLGQPNAGSTQAWADFLRQNNISHCNWAIADQGEATASQLVTGASASGGWSDAQLTTSGRLVKGIIQSW
ncbi:MAG TPA: glycoside hydrolase family 5 protein, partial [Polyangiaceae bacterium]|nr:glycoside hydrolase family 5 protein [Polyangiaceae bacterium]